MPDLPPLIDRGRREVEGEKLFEPMDPGQFPKPPVRRHRTEDLRQELRHEARTNLYFLCKGVLGYNKLVPHVHRDLCNFLCSPEILSKIFRRMIQLPRDHFKTTIATISHTIQLILLDPEVRILLVAQSSKNAERFLLEIKNHWKRNEKFQWLFPELIPENYSKIIWNKQEIEVPRRGVYREPTIDTIGSRGAVESRHYDWIKGDDIVGEKEKESDAEMEKTIEWASGLESLLTEPSPTEVQAGSHIDFIGTRYTATDVYAFLEEFFSHDEEPRPIGPHATMAGELAIFHRGARKDDGSGDPIFPELISKEFLDRLQRERPERYAAQYANNPKASGLNVFSEDWLRYWQPHDGRDGVLVLPKHLYDTSQSPIIVPQYALDVIVLFDPASGEGSSKQAMLVTGAYRRRGLLDLIILESHIGRYDATDAVELMFAIHERYPSLHFFSIEEYGYQNTIKYWMREKATREHLPMPPIRKFPPKGSSRAQQAKDKRIMGLQPMFRAGQIWVLEGMSELLEEYLFYPQTKYRDGLDCLAQGVEWWGTSWSQEQRDEAREREKKLLASFDRTGYGIKSGSEWMEGKREEMDRRRLVLR